MKPDASCKKSGITLIELMVVMGIIGILVAMLLPALGNARAQANAVACQSNMRQIAQAMLIYSGNNSGWVFPPLCDRTSPPRHAPCRSLCSSRRCSIRR